MQGTAGTGTGTGTGGGSSANGVGVRLKRNSCWTSKPTDFDYLV
jgi:hypothetical protein